MSYDASTGLSGFDIAIQGLKRGEAWRRTAWPKSIQSLRVFDSASSREKRLQFESGTRSWMAELSSTDLLASDWEVAL